MAASGVALDEPVPSCPGWRVTDVLRHVGSVHRRAAVIIGERRSAKPHRRESAPPPGDPVGWLRSSNAALLSALDGADPDAGYWTFRGARPLRWWLRRLAHETTIHRIDLDHAGGCVADVETGLAADGIDELLETYLPVIAPLRDIPRAVVVTLVAPDVGTSWTVTVGAGATSIVNEADTAVASDAVVSGAAADLYRWLWGRGPDRVLAVVGDPAAAETLLDATRV